MNILLIHQAFASDKEAGGTRHFELGQRLVEEGHRFTVVASSVNILSGERVAEGRPRLGVPTRYGKMVVWRAYSYPHIHRGHLHRLLGFIVFMVTSLLTALRVRQMDLVLGTSPPIFQAITAYLTARLRRVPFVLEIRDLWPDFPAQAGVIRNPVVIALARRLESFLYRHADHIIVNSPGFLPHLRRYVPAGKVSLVANGVSVEMFDPKLSGEEYRRQWGLEGKFVALYAGAHAVSYNIETLLRAMALLRSEPDIALVLIGDGVDKPRLLEMSREMGLENVLFVSPQPKQEMPGVVAAADACVAILKDIPMFRTVYPNKVFDYMAAGKPTVLAIGGVIRNVIEQAHGGIFVEPADPQAIADALLTLCRRPELGREMGRSARRYVEQHFDRKSQAVLFERVLLDVLARRSEA